MDKSKFMLSVRLLAWDSDGLQNSAEELETAEQYLKQLSQSFKRYKAGSFTIYIYTDDSCLRVDLSGDIKADQKLLDEIMKDVVKYMNSPKLKFNFGKSEFEIASPKCYADYKDLVLNFSGNIVKQQLHARLLGL